MYHLFMVYKFRLSTPSLIQVNIFKVLTSNLPGTKNRIFNITNLQNPKIKYLPVPAQKQIPAKIHAGLSKSVSAFCGSCGDVAGRALQTRIQNRKAIGTGEIRANEGTRSR
jgi:hypothetical protein